MPETFTLHSLQWVGLTLLCFHHHQLETCFFFIQKKKEKKKPKAKKISFPQKCQTVSPSALRMTSAHWWRRKSFSCTVILPTLLLHKTLLCFGTKGTKSWNQVLKVGNCFICKSCLFCDARKNYKCSQTCISNKNYIKIHVLKWS